MTLTDSPVSIASHGFLPLEDPLDHLPSGYDAWEAVAHDLPKLLVSAKLRAAIERLSAFDAEGLVMDDELERAMTILSYIGHAYVWGMREPAHVLPAVLAVPWHRVAQRVGRPPVLSYASYALHNWRRIDPTGPVALGNISLLQNFLGGLDEEWFILVHVDIESRASPAIRALLPAQAAAATHDLSALGRHLATIRDALAAMNVTMDRMPEGCDPYIYYTRVRPYIFGWKDNPGLPNGLLYSGVVE